jgi:energy-coupling factor transporter transmembrane protein EcfT
MRFSAYAVLFVFVVYSVSSKKHFFQSIQILLAIGGFITFFFVPALYFKDILLYLKWRQGFFQYMTLFVPWGVFFLWFNLGPLQKLWNYIDKLKEDKWDENDWFEKHGYGKGPNFKHWFWGRYLSSSDWMVRDAAQKALMYENNCWSRVQKFRTMLNENRKKEALKKISQK